MNEPNQLPGVMLYRHFYEAFAPLDDGTLGRLTRALMEYAFFGREPDLPPEHHISWAFLRNYIDRDAARYQEKTQRRRAAVEKRWNRERAKESEKTAAPKSAPAPPLASTSGGGGRATARSEGACSGVAAAPPVSPTASQPPRRWGQDTAPPQEKKEEQAFGNIEWMENHVYRDEKGIIRYK